MRQQLTASQHLSDRYQTELAGERIFRADLESRMNVLVKECAQQVNAAEQSAADVRQRFESLLGEHTKTVGTLRQLLAAGGDARKTMERKCAHMHALYKELLLCHGRTADAMRNEPIDLAQTVDELQLNCLQLREELIDNVASREHVQSTMQNEVGLLRQAVSGSCVFA